MGRGPLRVSSQHASVLPRLTVEARATICPRISPSLLPPQPRKSIQPLTRARARAWNVTVRLLLPQPAHGYSTEILCCRS